MKPKASLTLPDDVLLDSLMHLPPSEVDALRFVSRAYNSLVVKHGVRLPKHTIDHLYTYIPMWLLGSREKEVSRSKAVAWFTQQHSCKDSYGGGLTLAGLQSILIRVCLLSKLTVGEDSKRTQILDVIYDAARMKVRVGKMRLWGHSPHDLHEVLSAAVQLPDLQCLEVFGAEGIFSYPQLYRHFPNFVYHFPRRDFSYGDGALSFLTDGRFCGRAVFSLDSIDDCYHGVPIVRNFIQDVIRRFTAAHRESELHFPKVDFLLVRLSPGKKKYFENWERVLGRPDERSHHIAEWPGAFAIYTELNNYSWKVWRVRSPHIPAAEGAVAGKNCEKYMRVMLRTGEGRKERVSLAVHFQLFGFDGYTESE